MKVAVTGSSGLTGTALAAGALAAAGYRFRSPALPEALSAELTGSNRALSNG